MRAWCGTGLVVVAGVLLRFLGVSIPRAVAFVLAVLVGTGLIVSSIRHSNDEDEP